MIAHLIIIAGPSSAGKSTFARRMRENRVPELNERLGIADFSATPALRRSDWRADPSRAAGEAVIFQYNITCDRETAKNYNVQLFEQAKSLSIITLWTPPKRLLRHRLKRLRRNLGRNGDRSLGWRGHALLKTLSYHARPRKVLQNYRAWFDFCGHQSAKLREHMIVEYQDAARFITMEQWEDEAGIPVKDR